ncbi:noncanonical pyrimidine nucleotidase, YjjG family [Mucilaginibacter hurinus]|uniref:Noncanonical pyrimidine nucleotidase, YjjG family n=1 Tax=Mucilaginibacter hurinus TaxID=2201324 RepID=A0A367GMA7_9SPHI|nr:YjjG family noncanonical pyrimidine nucleotidase [Mucilaginibacter hurinus]RCH54612.1 noncanonical pyrimidine nucleotidase, YjjG family [Mucilaginibacter hurinus]
MISDNLETEKPAFKATNYKHIFFDLDHTIWDFDRNAEETLHELYKTHRLKEIGLHSPDLFIETYTRNNHRLWTDYHLGKITKQVLRETRFKTTFIELGLSPDIIPPAFEDDYVRICPTKTHLFPHAHETLQYLHAKYTLHLITNGFMEATGLKIHGTGIAQYFKNVIISELVGFNKPDRAIFKHAVNLAGCNECDCLMIGDSIEADVRGALACGIDAIYFNPNGTEKPDDVTSQIQHLQELTRIL